MMIRHIVLMKCQAEASQKDIKAMFAALAALQEQIPGILAFEGGANNSPEGLARGYTHGFTMDFADEETRAVYLPHPEHKKAQEFMRKVMDNTPENVLGNRLSYRSHRHLRRVSNLIMKMDYNG